MFHLKRNRGNLNLRMHLSQNHFVWWNCQLCFDGCSSIEKKQIHIKTPVTFLWLLNRLKMFSHPEHILGLQMWNTERHAWVRAVYLWMASGPWFETYYFESWQMSHEEQTTGHYFVSNSPWLFFLEMCCNTVLSHWFACHCKRDHFFEHILEQNRWCKWTHASQQEVSQTWCQYAILPESWHFSFEGWVRIHSCCSLKWV